MNNQSKSLLGAKEKEILDSYEEKVKELIKEYTKSLYNGNLTKLKNEMDKAWIKVIENIEESRKK